MPALNFKAQFAPLVESGAKRRTIRAFRKDKRDPKQGDTLYLYTGLRTKYAKPITISNKIDAVTMEINANGAMGYMCTRAALQIGTKCAIGSIKRTACRLMAC